MVADVISFPTKDERDESRWRAAIKNLMAEGLPWEGAEWIALEFCSRVTEVRNRIPAGVLIPLPSVPSPEFSAEIDDKLGAYEAEIFAAFEGEIFELVVQLWLAKFGGDDPQVTFEVPKPKDL